MIATPASPGAVMMAAMVSMGRRLLKGWKVEKLNGWKVEEEEFLVSGFWLKRKREKVSRFWFQVSR
jgi:hypothetical protein